jgi:hypothetical protein
MTRCAPAASVKLAVEESENSVVVPEQRARLFTVSVDVPRFEIVTFCVTLVLTAILFPNSTACGAA